MIQANKIIQIAGYAVFFTLFTAIFYFLLIKKTFHLQINVPVLLISEIIFLALGRIIRRILQWDS